MRIAVVGASGLTGQLVIAQAIEKGFDVTAYVRHADSIPKREKLTVCEGELSDLPALQNAFQGVDAVLCCLGTRSMRFAREVSLMRRSLPVIVSAMQKSNVSRIILLSAFGVGDSARLAGYGARAIYKIAVRAIYRDKALAEEALIHTALKWTIFYPVALTNGSAQKTIDVRPLSDLSKLPGMPRVARANVARSMIEAVENDETIRQRLVMTPVGTAF